MRFHCISDVLLMLLVPPLAVYFASKGLGLRAVWPGTIMSFLVSLYIVVRAYLASLGGA